MIDSNVQVKLIRLARVLYKPSLNDGHLLFVFCFSCWFADHRYPEARSIQRRIVYHAGPTNSGKTYHALERFMSSKSGVYCGPLRLLANEVFTKTNAAVSMSWQENCVWWWISDIWYCMIISQGRQCDLITGEERRFMGEENEPSNHVACTVEMTSVTTPCKKISFIYINQFSDYIVISYFT